jgi:universal stress protein A
MKYQHIVAAVDIYEEQQAALSRAIALAKENEASLEVVHVMPQVVVSMPYSNEFQMDLQEDVKKRFSEVVAKSAFPMAKTHLLVGSAARESVRVAKEVNADLMVVGSHGKHGIDLMLGSTANAIVHQAPCDVLTVRIDAHDIPVTLGKYKKVLLATDLNEDNRPVINAAYAKAKAQGAELFIINVVPETASMASVYIPSIELDLQKHALVTMETLAQEFKVPIEHTQVKIGSPKHDILHYAHEIDADLIVIGSHGRKALAAFVLGSTANAVLHGAKTDVLVVRVHRH